MKNYHPTDDLDDTFHPADDSRFDRNDPRLKNLPIESNDTSFRTEVFFALAMLAVPLAPIILIFFLS